MAKNKSSTKSERFFQMALLLLGFLLGSVSTYVWQIRQEKINTEATIAILRAGVRNEINAMNERRKLIIERAFTEEVNPLLKEADYARDMLEGTPHEPSTYQPSPHDLGGLPPGV